MLRHALIIFLLLALMDFLPPVRGDDQALSCAQQQERRIQDMEAELSSMRISLKASKEKLASLNKREKWKSQTVNILKRNLQLITGSSENDWSRDVISTRRRAVEECTNYEHLRLVNGSSNFEGRLEVKVGDIWMNVCEDDWSRQSAKMVCSMLGHPGSGAVPVGGKVFGNGGLQVMPGSSSCSSSAGVICGDFENYPVRIANGTNPYEGRVEMRVGSEWGTICQASWDAHEAQVVCDMLGYSGFGAVAVTGALFGQGTGPVWMQGLDCQGTESHLLQCPSSSVLGSRSSCSHSGDVGVICGDLHFYPVRLVGGRNEYEGRVEIKFRGDWSSIYDGNWDTNDANVICRMLGYDGRNAIPVYDSQFGRGSGPQLFGYLNCEGTEQHIMLCPSSYTLGSNHWVSHGDDAGVRCQP